MKKFAALILGSAMALTSIAGLAACGKGSVSRREDPRAADAYEAYDHSGAKIGGYKTIADAINATVEADKDYFEAESTVVASQGGYVVKKGGTRHLFDNRKGFADGNSDCFWYYQNGTELAGFNCWDNTTGISTLQNAKIIAHETTTNGLDSIQSWNGYGLLDQNGQEIPTTTVMAQSWELSSPMDAGVMMFPARKKGNSGLKYKLDLSNVKITPAYEGVEDPVYAYIGFYAWQDYYVVGLGIACNVTTGDWYAYEGTSRDNSFSDYVYDIGDKIMGSTWDKKEGCFKPDFTSLDMDVKTQRMTDEEGDNYWVDQMNFVLHGKKDVTYSITLDDEKLNNLFAGVPLTADNGFVFTAGLDIKNPISKGNNVKNVDYFNGAKFENLTVTEAGIYFPTEEEMTDTEYAIGKIDPAVRGQYHDALLANSEYTEGTYDYTILNNYLCATYTAENGKDVYNFRFDGSPVSENEVGGKLKEYQDKIDALKAVTEDNAQTMKAQIDEVAKWYGADETHANAQDCLPQYYNVLDFAPFVAARETYKNSFKLSEAAQKIRSDFEAISTYVTYDYKGWDAPEGTTDIKGYLHSEIEAFKTIKEAYDALGADDKGVFFNVVDENNWVSWESLLDVLTIEQETFSGEEGKVTVGNETMSGTVQYTVEEAIEKLFEVSFRIRKCNYLNAEGANEVPADERGTFDSDANGCYFDSFHVLYLLKVFENEEIDLPDAYWDVTYAALTATPRSAGFATDFDYIYNVLSLEKKIRDMDAAEEYAWLDADMAAIVNKYMINFKFTEGGFNWNITSGDIRDRETNYEIYFGLTNQEKNFKANIARVIEVVTTCDSNVSVTENGLGFTAEVTALTADPSTNGSTEAVAVETAIKALTALNSEYDYKGWTTTDETKTGYLFSEVTAFRALVTARNALDAAGKAYVNANTKEQVANYNAWLKLSEQLATLEANAVWAQTIEVVELGHEKTQKNTFTGQQALAEILKTLYAFEAGTINAGYYGETGSGTDSFATKGDETFFTASYIARFVTFFTDAKLTLPDFVRDKLEVHEYEKYYNEFYYPVVESMKLGNIIHEGTITKMEDFSEAQIAFLNEVWTASYEQKGILFTHWNAGGKLDGWWGERTPRLVQDIFDATGKPMTYIGYLSAFLAEQHYTLNANEWGVTADRIFNISLTQDVLDVINNFNKLGNFATYSSNGWQAEDDNITGYLLSESEYFVNTIKPAYEALTEQYQEVVLSVVGSTNYNLWEALATQIVANKDAAWLNTEIAAATRDMSATHTYTVKETFGEILTAVASVSFPYATADAPSDDQGRYEGYYRIYFFLFMYEHTEGLTVPTQLTDAIKSIVALKERADATAGKNTADLKADVEYLTTVLTIKKLLLDGEGTATLTQNLVDMINATMVGKTQFTEAGIAYNYGFGDDDDLAPYRGTNYKNYCGVAPSLTLKSIIADVLAFLGTQGAEANAEGYGIVSAISLPAAE